MSSNALSVTRSIPSAIFYRQEWDTPEIPEGMALGPLYYNEAIGVAVSRYNDLEVTFRSFVGYFSGIKGQKGDALLTHVGAVTLIESFRAIASVSECHDVVKQEIEYACDLFDTNRINRNFIAHSTTGSSLTITGPHGDGKLMTKRSARGSVKIDHFLASIEAFRRTADQIIECHEYISLLVGPCSHCPNEGNVELPHRPPKPPLLANSLPKGAFADLVHIRTPEPKS